MNTETQPALLVDPAQRIFKVARRNFVDPEIFEAEKERSSTGRGSISDIPRNCRSPEITSPGSVPVEVFSSPVTAKGSFAPC